MTVTDCLPRETLKEYLAGWSTPEVSDAIEAHLAECTQCEETVVELEAHPESLIEIARHSGVDPSEPSSALSAALSRVRHLVDASLDGLRNEESLPADAEQIPAGDIGAYTLLRALGRGGMGAVYLARHRQLGKQVAIKMLPAGRVRGEHYTTRFLREIQAAGGLEHAAVVNATDAGEHEGTHYLVMEYIDGFDLSRIASLVGQLSIADACAVVRTAALGLSHAHASGIVHRDIKPSNLMLSTSGQTKILDFGLARHHLWDEASAELTTVGQLMGTLDYMAPEQAERAEAVDYRADLYSLGATLFRLLCGHAPLAATPNLSPLAKLRLLATSESPSLATLRPDAPPELVKLVKSLLARDPADRPASAAHVAEQLQPFTSGADLVALVANAQSQAKQSERPGIGESDSGPLPTPKMLPSNGNQGRSRTAWLTLAALAPLAIFAGVLITLELQKGQLVIESEADNVSVKLLRDGEFYQQLKIEPGVNATRLYAGTYQVEIDQGSDAVQFDTNRLTIHKGETTIARVEFLPQTEADTVAGLPADSAATYGGEPLYDGQPLSHWLEQLARERSPQALGAALVAIRALLTDATAARITAELLAILPSLDGRLTVELGKDQSTNLDSQGFHVLRQANPGAGFAQVLATELERGPTAWSKRVLSLAYLCENDFQPLVDRMREHLFVPSGDRELLEPAAWYLFGLLNAGHGDPAEQDDILATLENCADLGSDFWLKYFLKRSEANPKLLVVIERRASEAFCAPETPASLVAQAAITLAWMSDQGLQELDTHETDALHRRLQAATAARLFELVPVEDSYAAATSPMNSVPKSVAGRGGGSFALVPVVRGVTISIDGSQAEACLPLVLLDLIPNGKAEDFAQELNTIQAATESGHAVVDRLLRTYPALIQLSWPARQLNSNSSFTRSYPLPVTPTPDDWLSYFLHRRALQLLPAEPEQAGDNATALTEPATPPGRSLGGSPPATKSKPAEMLYDGKGLAEWLDILSRERSPQALGEAFAAVYALLTPATAERVTTTLLNVLPKLNGSMSLKREGAAYGSVDSKGFALLKKANPGAAYYQLLLEELEKSSDVAWSTRWLQASSTASADELSQLQPLLVWLAKNVFQAAEPSELLPAAADFYVTLINVSSLVDDSQREQWIQTLIDCPHLGHAFWLREPPSRSNLGFSGSRRVSPAVSQWTQAICTQAISAFASQDTPMQYTVQASLILGQTGSGLAPLVGAEAMATLRRALRQRLAEIAKDSDRLYALVEVDQRFVWPLAAKRALAVNGCRIDIGRASSSTTQSLTIRLLDLASALELTADLSNEMVEVFRATQPLALQLFASLEMDESSGRRTTQADIELSWPELRIIASSHVTFRSPISPRHWLAMLLRESIPLSSALNQQLWMEFRHAEHDANADGVLDEAELAALGKTMNGHLEFSLADEDDNQSVSVEELVGYFERGMPRVPAPPAKLQVVDGDALEYAKRQIGKYDLNGDGMLTKSEWEKMIIKPTGADANGDGVITAEEYAAFRAKK